MRTARRSFWRSVALPGGTTASRVGISRPTSSSPTGWSRSFPHELKPLFEARRAFIVERSHRPRPLAQRRLGRRAAESLSRSGLTIRLRPVSIRRRCPATTTRRWRSSARTSCTTQGLLPWRAAEFYGRLQRAFASLKRPAPSPVRARQHRAVLGDAGALRERRPRAAPRRDELQRPAHRSSRARIAVGSRTVRAESRAGSDASRPCRARRSPTRATSCSTSCSRATALAASVLESDRKAASGREFYDDAFFDAFRDGMLPVLDQRVTDSIVGRGRVHCRRMGASREARRARHPGAAAAPDSEGAVTASRAAVASPGEPSASRRRPSQHARLPHSDRSRTRTSRTTNRPTSPMTTRRAPTKAGSRRQRRRFRDMLREAEAERHRRHAHDAAEQPGVALRLQTEVHAVDGRACGRAALAVALAHGRPRPL